MFKTQLKKEPLKNDLQPFAEPPHVYGFDDLGGKEIAGQDEDEPRCENGGQALHVDTGRQIGEADRYRRCRHQDGGYVKSFGGVAPEKRNFRRADQMYDQSLRNGTEHKPTALEDGGHSYGIRPDHPPQDREAG